MRNILRRAEIRTCTCAGRMVPILIRHGFKRDSDTGTGYQLHYSCQTCGKTAVFLSPLYLAHVCFVFCLGGGGLVFLLVNFPDSQGAGSANMAWAIGLVMVAAGLFLWSAWQLFKQARNRMRYRKTGGSQ